MPDTVRFTRIPTNGITLHAAEAGPADGPLLILLHGFPEFWYEWRSLIGPFADRGFHVVAPDMRGYNLSDKPAGTPSYDLDLLAADVAGIADHFGARQFDLVGHDWGSAVGWWFASKSSDRLHHFAALNTPHPAIWLEAARSNPVQRRKSAYVAFFQIPRLPEALIRLSGYRALSNAFRDCTRPGAFTPPDLENYRKAWRQPGALTAMINYYRAARRKSDVRPADVRITCPTLVAWGKNDAYVIPELAEASARLCTNARVVYFDNATHWLPHDEPERLLDLLSEFLSA